LTIFNSSDIFTRCQINIATNQENPECFTPSDDITLFDEVILQQRGADKCQLFLNTYQKEPNDHITTLLDASGGEGINTPIIPLNIMSLQMTTKKKQLYQQQKGMLPLK
jgi:hypothetical protein